MRRLSHYLLATALTLFIAHFSGAQEYPVLHYTVEDGVPSNNVYQVYHDRAGFLWIGTDKGIARYNGIRFEKFTTYDGLADNEVFSFVEDYYGRLWMATYSGKLCYYQDGVFHNPSNTSFLKVPVKATYISTFSLAPDSSVVVNYCDNDILLDIKKDTFYRIDLHKLNQFVHKRLPVLYKQKMSENSYQLTTDSSDVFIDSLCNIISIVKRNYGFFTGVSPSQDKKYFLNGDYIYSEDKQLIYQFKKGFAQEILTHTYYSDSSNFFLTTKQGLFINDSINILRDCHVSSITQDSKGNYWIGTLNNGIYCIKKDFGNTRIIKNVYSGKVNYYYCDTGHLFFALADNDLLTYENGAVRKIFDYRKFRKGNNTFPSPPGFLIEKKNKVYNYYNLYGTDNISIHNILSRHPTVHATGNVHISLITKALFTDGNDIFIKGRNKIVRVDNSRSMIGKEVKSAYSPDSTSGYKIFGMAIAPDKSLYYSTINHVYKIDHGVNQIQPQFNNISFKTMDIPGNYMLGITHDNKLMICNNISGKISITPVPDQDCVWDNFFKLNDRLIIVSTNNLYRLITLLPSDDTPDYSIATIENPFIPLLAEAICSDSGNCYFFKDGNITITRLNDLFVKPDPPTLFFASLKTSGKTYAIGQDVQITFRESKNLRVAYSTLSFGGKDVSYQYSFSKNDQDNWIDVKGEDINLVNPGYGNYIMKVRAKTITSGYCTPIVFALHILNPYWATWWFILLAVITGLALIGAVIRYRILYALHKNEKEHKNEIKFLKSEYKALNALMNPHFIFNTLNNVQGLINRNEKLAANRYLGIFANLIRQNMHNISLELIPLQKEIEIVTNYLELEKLRFKDLLNYEIIIDKDVDIAEIMIPPLLIQPLVENSIKHGMLPGKPAGSFIITEISEKDNVLLITVKDNGIGIEAAQKRSDNLHQSFGLQNIRKRIEQLAIIQNKQIALTISDIKDDAGILQWTVVTISISIS